MNSNEWPLFEITYENGSQAIIAAPAWTALGTLRNYIAIEEGLRSGNEETSL